MYDVTVRTSRGSQEKKELTEKSLPRIWTNPKLHDIVKKIFEESSGAIWDGGLLCLIRCYELKNDAKVSPLSIP
jgi:hypothetical protein